MALTARRWLPSFECAVSRDCMQAGLVLMSPAVKLRLQTLGLSLRPPRTSGARWRPSCGSSAARTPSGMSTCRRRPFRRPFTRWYAFSLQVMTAPHFRVLQVAFQPGYRQGSWARSAPIMLCALAAYRPLELLEVEGRWRGWLSLAH